MRLGVVAVVVEDRAVVMKVQELLSEYSDVILGRMGLPDKESGQSVITVIVKGSLERISAFSGKLGKLEHVSVKSALTSKEV